MTSDGPRCFPQDVSPEVGKKCDTTVLGVVGGQPKFEGINLIGETMERRLKEENTISV